MKIIVIGAGIIGTVTAWHLAQRGHQVTVIDRFAGAGKGASAANGAQLSYGYIEPLADPSLLLSLPKWLLAKDAPFKLHVQPDPAMWRWCGQFFKECKPKAFQKNREALFHLALYSKQVMEAFLAEYPIPFFYHQHGKLHLYGDKKSWEDAKDGAQWKEQLGYPQEILSAEACITREPSLAGYYEKIAGGIFSPGDAAGDSFAFIQNLIQLMQEKDLPVRFEFNTSCKALLTEQGKLRALETDKGTMEADSYVVAAGVYSAKLLHGIGINVPIYPVKGHSITVPIRDMAKVPDASITDHRRRMVYARLGDNMRVAGFADLGGYNTSCSESRINNLKQGLEATFPGGCDTSILSPWAGLRPVTPHSRPIISKTGYANLYLNIGHGMLGWTLAQGSAALLADIIENKSINLLFNN